MNNSALASAKSNSPDKSAYDPVVARRFFESAGDVVEVAAGKVIFHEDEQGNRLLLQKDKMYFLVDGEIDLSVRNRRVGAVQAGEIFGELASITHSPRSATATAKTSCRMIALDEKQFRAGLRAHPEFSLNMMALMVGRLRKMIARLNADAGVPVNADWNEGGVFGKKQLMELVDTFGSTVITRYTPGKLIMQEGQVGLLMYIVLEGVVEVTIHGRVVEQIGEGGMFGEMALIGRTERLASAVAVTECSLLSINRKDFFDLLKTNPEFGVALLAAVGERARFIATCFAL